MRAWTLCRASSIVLTMGATTISGQASGQAHTGAGPQSDSRDAQRLNEPVPGAQPTTTTGPATAQADTQAASTNQVGDIIVTAQRRAESLSRVGISVAALGAEDLVRQGVTRPQDLAGKIPGLTSTSSYGGGSTYFIRGVGFNNVNSSSTAAVGIYIDEASLPYNYMANGVSFDLERVEVLKGPQGTLYGRNTTGGLVNYVTAKPTTEFRGGVSFEVGNYQTVNVSTFVSGPLSDTVRVRLAADVRNRNGDWQYSVTRDEGLGKFHSYAGRAIIDIGNGGPFKATLTGTGWNQYGDTQAPQAIFYRFAASPIARPATAASVIANPTNNRQADWYSVTRQTLADQGNTYDGPRTNSSFGAAMLNMSYEFSDTIRIASLTNYDYLDRFDSSDAAGTQTNVLSIESSGTLRSLSQELRLIGESERFNWSVGGYLADDHTTERAVGFIDENGQIDQLRFVASTLPQTTFTQAQIRRSFGNFDSIGTVDSNIYAGFANAEFTFNDVFKLGAGGRHTRDVANYDGCTYDTNGTNIPIVNLVYPLFIRRAVNLQPNACYTLKSDLSGFVDGSVQRRQAQNNFSFHVTGTVTPSPTTLFYGSVSRGFKAGSFPILAASNETQLDPVRQEQLTAYEIGTKLGLFDRRIQLNASAFYYDYKDKQAYGRVADIIFGSLARIRNIPKSRIYGVEGDLTVRVVPGVTAIAAGAYLKSKVLGTYDDFNDLGAPVQVGGRPFAYTPEFSGSGTLVLDTPITDRLRLNASGTVTYQTKSSGDLAGLEQFRIKDYALVSGTAGIASSEGWEVGLYAKNLFDQYYWTGVVAGVDTVYRYSGMPREFGLRASFKY